ncbi:hypothetical protein AAIH70_16100 [Neorhizobium sp. BT27B]|uniref:hypothetical protein n=1 Tax=Neorhizobium sp. BT27B TaxID=3142625 RepID=UPI003D2D1398
MANIVRLMIISAVLTLSSITASAQGLTVMAVKTALEDALKAFNSAINTAGNEVRSSGTSLATNAQNVIVDMNDQLGGRLTMSISQLDGLQRRLADDAIVLTRQIQQATLAVTNAAGEQTRQTIFEADITAYNASYSLPCRTLTPRIVYANPSALRRGSDLAEVRLRGNFLDIGENPTVKIDGKAADIIARSRNELVASIPKEVIDSISDTRSLPVAVRIDQAKRTNFWVYCYDRNTEMDSSLSTAIIVKPELYYNIHGSISGMYDVYDPWSHTFRYSKSDDDCGANYDDTQQFCAPDGYKLNPSGPFGIAKYSANCNSSIGDPQIAGARCVTVPAHLGGCGYRNFYLGRECRGRGFFEYDVTVNAQVATRSAIQTYEFDHSSNGSVQRSFQATHPSAINPLPNVAWQYSIVVDIKEGTKTIKTISAGTGSPNPEGVVSRMVDGTVYIEVKD